jgi:hypothetical protein
LKDFIYLLNISNNSYYNSTREELSFSFNDLFPNIIIKHLNRFINDIKYKELFVIIPALINTNYVDNKNLHVLSTIYLKYVEKSKFKELIELNYLFAICNLESEIYWKKILDCLNLDLVCIKNYLEGNDNLENLIGFYDKKELTLLEKTVK